MFSKSTKLSEKNLLNVNVNSQLKPRGRFRPKLCKFSKSTKLSIKSAFENVNFQFKTREEYFNSQSHYLHQMLRSINLVCVWCLNKQINSFWEILFAQSLYWVHNTQIVAIICIIENNLWAHVCWIDPNWDHLDIYETKLWKLLASLIFMESTCTSLMNPAVANSRRSLRCRFASP